MRDIFTLVGRIRTEGFDALQAGLKAADKQLTKTVNNIDRFGRNVAKLGGNLTKLTAPIAAVGAGMAAAAIQAGEYADRMLDLTEITGLSTDTLQELENVARVAGVEFDGLATTIAKLENQMPNIINGTGGASQAINALGVSVFDSAGNTRDMNDLFPELVKKLQSVENVTDRNVLAHQLFGRSLKDLAPVLGMTGEQFDAARKQAHDLGLVMSNESLQAADDFRLSVDQLKAQFQALWRNLASQFIPIFSGTILPLIRDQLVPVFLGLAKQVAGVAGWFNSLSAPVKDTTVRLAAMLVLLGPMLIGIGKMIGLVKTMVVTMRLLWATMIMNPIGLIITSIGLLIVAGIALYKNWDFVKAKMQEAWDAISYVTLQAVSEMKMALWMFVRDWLDGVAQITKVIPGLNQAVDSASAAMSEMIAKEREAIAARKIHRAETKLQAEQNVELTATVAAAKQATDQYATSTLQNVVASEADADATQKQIDKANELARARMDFESGWSEKLRGQVMNRKQLLEWEYQEALKKADEFGASRNDIESYYSIERMKLDQEEIDAKDKIAQEGKQKEDERRQAAFDMGVAVVEQTFELFRMATDNKIALIDQQTAREKAAIEASTLSEEQKKAKIEALDADADAKKKALMLKQAKRDKAAAIFSAIISAALGVSRALSSMGPPLNFIMAAIVGALGAIQIGLIAAQPLPQLAEGGLVRKRPGGVQATIGEGNQDELVLPMKSGMRDLVGGVMQGLKGVAGAVLPPTAPALAMGGGGAAALAGNAGGGLHLHIGTLIADDGGLKQLERTLYKFRVAEAQRKGKAA